MNSVRFGPVCVRPSARYSHAHRRGFTLLEMMLVVVIIGLLATVVVYSIGGRGNAARRQVTVAKISQVKSMISNFQLDTGSYPSSLAALVPKYLDKIPPDAWKRALVYTIPSPDGKPYALFSFGEDGQPGTEDDINVWTMDEEPAAGNP